MCRYLGLVCGGYERSIFFGFDTTTDTGITRFRRPLLTEGERQRMSEWLASSVPPKTALRLLSQIESECEKATPARDIQICHGPFGVFRLSREQSALPCDPLPDGSDGIPPPKAFVHAEADSLALSDSALSPWTQELVQSILDEPECIPCWSSPNFFDMAMEAGCVPEICEAIPEPGIQGILITPPESQSLQFPQFISDAQFEQSLSPTSVFSAGTASTEVPQDAVILLKHYGSTVISSLTPVRHSKTPWHVLFIPHAKNCLAALTLGEHLDHASLSAFYGTLAISSFSLGGVSKSQMWLEQGRAYKQQAQEHLRLMLKTAYNVPKVSKYKSILMALVTMLQLSMLYGNRDQAEYYLLEAEKFIRLRGLKRSKSRKVHLLHHCYAFVRIFHESTFLCGTNSSQRHDVREAVESSGLIIYGQDSTSFRLIGWNNLDQEMMKLKGQEEGENDLHLERPGLFSATLYPEIYGIPESWIVLLSQVIRLGNQKDAAEQQNATNYLNLKEFLDRACAIERCINQLQRPSLATIASANYSRQIDRDVLENMLDGLKCALLIYFYRRIYNVNSSMLQQKVIGVRDCLLRCEHIDPTAVYGSPGFAWPAFIAACEAEDPEVQFSFSDWFKKSAQRSGLTSFTDTLEIIEQVWQEKRNINGTNVTWLDLMKKNILLQQHL